MCRTSSTHTLQQIKKNSWKQNMIITSVILVASTGIASWAGDSGCLKYGVFVAIWLNKLHELQQNLKQLAANCIEYKKITVGWHLVCKTQFNCFSPKILFKIQIKSFNYNDIYELYNSSS